MTAKKWFQLSEEGAGKLRLQALKFMFDKLGEFPVRIIAFFVVLSVFLQAKDRRNASLKFFKIINKKHLFLSAYRQFLNYGNSLVDKFLSVMGKLDPQKFELPEEDIFKSAFFITTHVGNVEIMRSLFQLKNKFEPKRVNIFLQANACKIFNDFLKTLELHIPEIEAFPVEEISPHTSIEISDRLQNGEIVFMAGDRISAQNENIAYEAEFLNHKVKFPLGTLKFALMLNVPVYFIVCVKDRKKYKIFVEKFVSDKQKRTEKLEDLKLQYVKFLEKYTLLYPEQFFNFYDMWE
mgnify:FL=1